MNVVLLITIIVSLSGQTILKRIYNDVSKVDGKYTFSAAIAFAAMLFFAITSNDISFDVGVLPYSVFFALFYGICTVCNFIAIASGPLSITALINSYSLILPTIYGLCFLKEPLGFGLVAGIILLALSLYLISKKSDSTPITLKWVVSVTLSFLGNGMCSVVQKMQQIAFDGEFKNEFMIMALAIVVFFLGVLVVVKERKNFRECAKPALLLGAGCGALNGVVNLFVMVLSGRMAVSLLFPTISAGDVVLTYIISRLCYKEQLSKRQFAGFCMGVISVILLNL